MKNIIWSISIGFLTLYSCGNPIKNESKAVEELAVVDTPKTESSIREPYSVTENYLIDSLQDLIGYWVGEFSPDFDLLPADYGENDYNGILYNKINLSIDTIFGDSVIGHSVVAGNRRPFRGTISLENERYKFDVVEPGDDKYDGTFQFSISLKDSIIRGSWAAYKEVKTSFRKFELKKTRFVYNPDAKLEDVYYDWSKVKSKKILDEDEEYLVDAFLSSQDGIFKVNPSSTILSKKDVENLSKADLLVLRNSIYAKHGYTFKKQSLRKYFDGQSWYVPVYTDIKPFITEIEKKNIELLMKYEKHAEEYYDVFGR